MIFFWRNYGKPQKTSGSIACFYGWIWTHKPQNKISDSGGGGDDDNNNSNNNDDDDDNDDDSIIAQIMVLC